MPALVEAIRDFRSKILQRKKEGVSVQHVKWDLLPSFIGRPINQQTMHELSAYVDQKLSEYSRIYGTYPAINNTDAAIDKNTASTGWAEVRDDHVASTYRQQDWFERPRPYALDDYRGMITIRIPSADLRRPDNVSYVTSYELDHVDLTLKARVITAPGNRIIDNSLWGDMCTKDEAVTLPELVKNTIKSNMVILIKNRNNPFKVESESDQKSLEALREMVSEKEFRKYLKYQFILVRGTKNRVYQIFSNQGHIKVWKNNKVIEEICVRISDPRVPKTDNLIAFKAMIESDEEEFRKYGNVYKISCAA